MNRYLVIMLGFYCCMYFLHAAFFVYIANNICNIYWKKVDKMDIFNKKIILLQIFGFFAAKK